MKINLLTNAIEWSRKMKEPIKYGRNGHFSAFFVKDEVLYTGIKTTD